MDMIKCLLSGDMERKEIRYYLAFMTTVFWGFIFLAWLGYPAEHKYSITTHTFSFLGSYNEEHSPQWWWLFSVAMLFWCFAGMVLAQYYRRRFSEDIRLGRVGGRHVVDAWMSEYRIGGYFS